MDAEAVTLFETFLLSERGKIGASFSCATVIPKKNLAHEVVVDSGSKETSNLRISWKALRTKGKGLQKRAWEVILSLDLWT